MAKGKKTGGRNFTRGNNFGRGRKPLPKELRELRAASYNELCRTIIAVMWMTEKEASEINIEELSLVERIVLKAFLDGEHNFIIYLWNRIWGKPTESHRIIDEDSHDRQLIIVSNDFLPQIEDKTA